jgi:integrase
MSVRKRAWTTSKGEQKEAWVVDYVDQGGTRRLKTFAKKKVADSFAATANVEIRAGIHTADSESVTVAKAGELWLETGEQAALERTTLDAYRQHLRLHIEPYLGKVAVAAIGSDGPGVRGQARPWRYARRRNVGAPVSGYGQEGPDFALCPAE